MALRAPWPGRRIAPLSPLRGAYPLQTNPDGSEFLRNSEMYNYGQIDKPLHLISEA